MIMQREVGTQRQIPDNQLMSTQLYNYIYMVVLFITYGDGLGAHHLNPTVQPPIEPGDRARPTREWAVRATEPRATSRPCAYAQSFARAAPHLRSVILQNNWAATRVVATKNGWALYQARNDWVLYQTRNGEEWLSVFLCVFWLNDLVYISNDWVFTWND
jgi:hypothetical protein